MKLKHIFLIILIISVCVDARKSEEEKEARRERRRQRQERRRLRKGQGGQEEPFEEQPLAFEETPNTGVQFPAEHQPPQSFAAPQDANQQCAAGTICTKAKDCPFVTSIGNGFPCPLQTRRGRPISGVCCPEATQPADDEETPFITPPVQFPAEDRRGGRRISSFLPNVPLITPRDVSRAVKKAVDFIRNIKNTENILTARKLFAPKSSREGAQSNFFGNDPSVNELSKSGQLSNQITTELASSFGLNQSQFETIAPTLNTPLKLAIRGAFPNSATGSCPEEINCRDWISYKYRTADGSCNNLQNTNWGKARTPFNRLLKPDYEDSFNDAKVTGRGSGQRLPSTRQVSATISPFFEEDPARDESTMFTYLLMQWGQFLAHDLTLTAISRSESGSSLKCCGPEFDANPNLLHPSCFPISIPADDSFFAQFGQNCMSFVRSAVAPRVNCALGTREQLNQLSSFIDGGNVYGSSGDATNGLRSFQSGQLLASNLNGEEFLPQPSSTCSAQRCSFKAGDGRVNVQPNLVTTHALFLRLHNQIARQLQTLNPSWSDEATFQETRRIIIALLQHITYSEYLPIILGKKIVNLFDLNVQRPGYSSSYDANVDPGIINSFATAAYRMHTMIPKSLSFADSTGNIFGVSDLADNYLNPTALSGQGSFSNLVNGLASSATSKFDPRHTDQITNHMFKSAGSSFGVDLLALNIQRGRDHGLPSYNRWRQICNLRTFNDFNSMSKVMRPGTVDKLQTLYSDPEDVDLYVGGNSELPLRGSLIGPTFACILGEQFRRIKNGDRFWYENGPSMTHSFTDAQLASLKNMTMARVICDAGPDVQTMQPFSFIQANNDWNVKSDCRDANKIPTLDLNPWINEPVVN